MMYACSTPWLLTLKTDDIEMGEKLIVGPIFAAHGDIGREEYRLACLQVTRCPPPIRETFVL